MKQVALLICCMACLLAAAFGWLPLIVAFDSFGLGTAAAYALAALGAACGFAAERMG